jgi:leucyl aminopeptidase
VRLRFVRRSAAGVRAVPLPAGNPAPKPHRAAVAGFTGRRGQVSEIVTRKRRLLLLGMGDAPHGALDWEAAGALASARLATLDRIALDARGLEVGAAVSLAAGACLRAWRFDRLRTRPEPDAARLADIDVLADDPAAAEAAWASTHAAVQGALFARDLVAEPGNILTPQGFAARLARLEAAGVSVEVLDAGQLRQEGLRALLAVGGGSANPPCLAVLRWRGTLPVPPVAFVGKGITFDTGGLSIKPAAGMWQMHGDMAGAAACAGAMLALALRRSPAPAVAVLALAENMPGAASYRPGDVIATHEGTTVEITDTDAEGRLVLADALAWTAANLRPQAMVDLATLTGAVIVALGGVMAGLFAKDEALDNVLAAHVAAAGAAVGERVWRLPIGDPRPEALMSDIADVRQCSLAPQVPDAMHAAAFLRRFVGGTPWVHLDIAGTEIREEACDRFALGPTGFGVRLLDRLMAQRFEEAER